MSTGGRIEGGPERIFDELKLKSREVTIGANNHHANWFECLRTRLAPQRSRGDWAQVSSLWGTWP